MKHCLLIPHYKHRQPLLALLPRLEATGLDCIIVDDGSDEDSVTAIKSYIEGKPNLFLYQHRHNRGKGAAVKTGFVCARLLGYTHVVQIDADGQHDIGDIQRFVELSQQYPNAIICGKPVFDASIPKIRLHGRKITTFWVWIETFSSTIKDGLCGFRVYPLDLMEQLNDHYYIGCHMDFDPELLVKAVWYNVTLKYIDTKVIYPERSISHFNYVRDNMTMIKLHVRLMLGMLVRIPLLIVNHFRVPRQ